ncbi:uncharacterized protein LOC143266908 [Peromyscus maniculatus bairdii]|uniref:uncharacterized protein LOC143266908 n=1 Tax=Peromyscus maniculatus bairdii TaxID=230844 RepID=UPI003FD1056E
MARPSDTHGSCRQGELATGRGGAGPLPPSPQPSGGTEDRGSGHPPQRATQAPSGGAVRQMQHKLLHPTGAGLVNFNLESTISDMATGSPALELYCPEVSSGIRDLTSCI